MAVQLCLFAPSMQICTDRSFPREIVLDVLQAKLERITGIPPSAQRLALYAFADIQDGQQTGDAAPVPFPLETPLSSAQDGMLLKILDSRGSAASLNDADVEKYTMSDEAYASRRDTVRAFKQAHHLGQFAPGVARPTVPDNIQVGARCIVSRGDASEDFARRGTIHFVGTTQFAPGAWVGIVYDEPVGKNDGSVQGTRYFDAAPKHGGFVRPALVTVGDFSPALAHEEI
ncbi:hypothetical protein MVES1_001230 [Malassezia vespertilionis]|uniref:CAP-Gly domain-containing protein n=1 Tax=Malassezia vespertilionis TaxID=2020962 RepID=A0A2N1JFE4_9BASI|nr:uncharacterized protein MVES1_001230 [Malassezia vespertilionis]PKI85272.1 hypothetical protein MVES_001160 [Malassezia vespertilionis]WFD05896.1 hypothetical protein MVES1_001230 [Malassezia vespertilionis]